MTDASAFSTAALFKAGYSQRGTGEWIINGKAKLTMQEQQPGLYEIEIKTRLGSLIVRANAKDILIKSAGLQASA